MLKAETDVLVNELGRLSVDPIYNPDDVQVQRLFHIEFRRIDFLQVDFQAVEELEPSCQLHELPFGLDA